MMKKLIICIECIVILILATEVVCLCWEKEMSVECAQARDWARVYQSPGCDNE